MASGGFLKFIQFWLNIRAPNLQIQVQWIMAHILTPWDPWGRPNSRDILVFTLKCQIFQWWRHLDFFFISFEIKPDVTSSDFTTKQRIFTTF